MCIYDLKYMLINFISVRDDLGTGGTYKEISRNSFTSINIPLPSLETQLKIVAEIQQEQGRLEANKALIERFEAKIAARIKRVWEKG